MTVYERKLNAVERYNQYRKVLQRPTFDSIENAEKNMRAKEGEFRRFIVRGPLGNYRVCFCFLSTPRGSDTQQWTYNEEYSFSHGHLYAMKQRAALAVGLDLIDSLE